MVNFFRKQNMKLLTNMSKEYGQEFMCTEDIWEYIDDEQRKRNKCNKCEMQCKNLDHLERHRDNPDCVRRQRIKAAELANQEYVPDYKKKNWCDLCKVSYHRYFKHNETNKHKDAVEAFLGKKFELKCMLCEKEFPNKVKMTRHLKNSKKCHRKVTDADQYLRWDCMCEKLHVRWDPKAVVLKV